MNFERDTVQPIAVTSLLAHSPRPTPLPNSEMITLCCAARLLPFLPAQTGGREGRNGCFSLLAPHGAWGAARTQQGLTDIYKARAYSCLLGHP